MNDFFKRRVNAQARKHNSPMVSLANSLTSQRVSRGFTLIEILVVIVILGILGAVVAPQILSRPDSARVQAAQLDLRTLASALEIYRLDNFNYP